MLTALHFLATAIIVGMAAILFALPSALWVNLSFKASGELVEWFGGKPDDADAIALRVVVMAFSVILFLLFVNDVLGAVASLFGGTAHE